MQESDWVVEGGGVSCGTMDASGQTVVLRRELAGNGCQKHLGEPLGGVWAGAWA